MGTRLCDHDDCCNYRLCAHPKCCAYRVGFDARPPHPDTMAGR